jgi:hypothetical protein
MIIEDSMDGKLSCKPLHAKYERAFLLARAGRWRERLRGVLRTRRGRRILRQRRVAVAATRRVLGRHRRGRRVVGLQSLGFSAAAVRGSFRSAKIAVTCMQQHEPARGPFAGWAASAYPDISKSNFEISKFDFELF